MDAGKGISPGCQVGPILEIHIFQCLQYDQPSNVPRKTTQCLLQLHGFSRWKMKSGWATNPNEYYSLADSQKIIHHNPPHLNTYFAQNFDSQTGSLQVSANDVSPKKKTVRFSNSSVTFRVDPPRDVLEWYVYIHSLDSAFIYIWQM